MTTKDWKPKNAAKVLLIGHDPRLQKSDTIAEYVLFADFFFRPEPKSQKEKRKYGLAKATFDYIAILTNGRFKPEDIYITNLCNTLLEHAPKNKTVLIPRDKAEIGLKNIKKVLLENPSIEYIFPMSMQVNYWLQKLNFHTSDSAFLEKTEPIEKGLKNKPPYFQPKTSRTFLLICGKKFKIKGDNQFLIPILHSKNYPLKDKLIAYEDSYKLIKGYFNK